MNTAATTQSAAPASGSTTSGKAMPAPTAVIASSPGAAKTAPEMPLTPGLEQLNASQIMDAFMGLPVELPSEEQKEETKTKTKPEEEESAEGDESEADGEGTEGEDDETEGDESDGEGGEEEDKEGEGEEPADGLEKALKDKPGLHKRVKKLMADNPRLKREVEALNQKVAAMSQQPEVVSAPDASNPLAAARTEAEVDKLAGEILSDAKAKLRWLNKHSDGGIWQEGTKDALEMSGPEVERWIEHYEGLTGKLDTVKSDRKAWLKTYGEIAKGLGADKVTALVKPTEATRESELFKKVPELMRMPDFLQLLADAQAGRETREKTAKGIKFVEVKAGKAKPEGGAKPGDGGSKAAAAGTAKAQPQQKQLHKQPEKTPLTSAALNKLREDAAAGSRSAQDELMKQFVGG